mmetsp:Transcript_32036/g.66406  ORF Transcript_32036/g.66406 Transcript_32036/m.66406 type:complete len:458 (-) Transcript_32036:144-1517(-)
MPKLQRPTPSTLEQWEHFPTVDDDVAQMRLARAMGYPPGWRVVRTLVRVPLPAPLAEQMRIGAPPDTVSVDERGVHSMLAVQDRIYAGDPATQPDGYYNHTAALAASSKFNWRPEYDDVVHDNNDDDYDDSEYCVTSHKNKGGQLKGREAKFEEGDIVEVLYLEDDDDDEEECEWYEATITKKTEYEDDIRYTVHYHEDDAIQANVRETLIRATEKTKKKKKATKNIKSTPKRKQITGSDDEMKVDSTPTSKKRGRPSGSKIKNQTSKKAKISNEEEEIPIAYFVAAKEMGFPEGWSAEDRGNDKWTFKSPNGKTYRTKKTAFAAAGLDLPPGQKKKLGRPKKEEMEEFVEENLIGVDGNPDLDEGDPPWRSTGHHYLSRRVRWTPPVGGLLEPKPSVGTIVGWISAEDVDSEGNPGFLSSVSGEPANLFHAVFEDFVQDFEEFELEECLLDEKSDE